MAGKFLRTFLILALAASSWAAPAAAARIGQRPQAAPPDPSSVTLKVWLIDDTHVNWNFGGTVVRNSVPLGALVDSLNVPGTCDAVINGGDWAMDVAVINSQANMDSMVAIYGRLKAQMYPCLGNHEAVPEDTLAQRSPYFTSMQFFPAFFGQGKEWYSVRIKGVVDVFVCMNVANMPNLTLLSDYRINNPTTYAYPEGGIQNKDWAGITNPDSPQRKAFRAWLSTRNKASVQILVGHRSWAGPDDITSRLNLLGLRGTGIVNEFEDTLAAGERGLVFTGDEHVDRITKAIHDSTLATPSTSGLYHLITTTGAGMRTADSLDIFPVGTTGLEMFVARNPADAGATNIARTSTGWIDGLTAAQDGGFNYQFLCKELQITGKTVVVKTWRVFTSQSAGMPGYPGAGHLKLVDQRTLSCQVN